MCGSKIHWPLDYAGERIATRELSYMDVYDKLVGTFLPMIPNQFLKNGLYVLPTSQVDAVGHGNRAATWAATAMGAVLCGDPIAEDYFNVAHAHLRECFDAPHLEVLSAHIAMCQLAFAIGKKAQFITYAGFADVLAAELKDVLSPELTACMSHTASHIARYTSEEIQFTPAASDDLHKLAEYPLNVQLLYIIDYGNNALYNYMKDSEKPVEQRRNHAKAVVKFIEPLLERLKTSGSDANPIGRFFCNALLTSVLPYIGRADECDQLVMENLSMISQQPSLLSIQCVWHVCDMMARRLATRGLHEISDQFTWLLQQHMACARDADLYATLITRKESRSYAAQLEQLSNEETSQADSLTQMCLPGPECTCGGTCGVEALAQDYELLQLLLSDDNSSTTASSLFE